MMQVSWRRIGCGLLFGLSWGALLACGDDAASSPADGGTGGAEDAAPVRDGGSETEEAATTPEPPPPTDSFGDVSRWRRFDPAAMLKVPFMSSGAVSDGHYLYVASGRGSFVSYYHKIMRYDLAKEMSDPAAWSIFDPASLAVDIDAGNIMFDGRFVYFTPGKDQYNAITGIVLRYDTMAGGPFESPSAWSSKDLTWLAPYAEYSSAILLDGFVYFVPHGLPYLTRYDTSKDFTADEAWQTLYLGEIRPTFLGQAYFSAAIYDGRYITFPPGTNYSIVARYDTTLPLEEAGSWEIFDVMSLSLQARSFRGAIYDGRYIYFAPNEDQVLFKAASSFVRYDTKGPLSDFESWAVMPVSRVSNVQSYSRGTFDGRYVYFAPGPSNAAALRLDSRGAFTDPASWENFSFASLDTAARGYSGAAFDGTYVYFTPNYVASNSSVTAPLLRFRAIDSDQGSP